ncbi:hypothetical protein ANCDUO_05955 [Ancylostoma duodenale]|uniref:Reverse transcriptase domain-containing protein n=1 Tax=Ancylostoma duodenale TaxID=51022 RepID=A0A0C2H2R8_9BILA|nr:hypothetical protein ANCDUO_05955 [Ancylostoma duodenale]
MEGEYHHPGLREERRCAGVRQLSRHQTDLSYYEGIQVPGEQMVEIMEKYREKGEEIHFVFLDLEKAYDRLPKTVLWEAMREQLVPEHMNT